MALRCVLLDMGGTLAHERVRRLVGMGGGVRELIDRMRAAGLELAVATSAREDELRLLLKIAGAEDLAAAGAAP